MIVKFALINKIMIVIAHVLLVCCWLVDGHRVHSTTIKPNFYPYILSLVYHMFTGIAYSDRIIFKAST